MKTKYIVIIVLSLLLATGIFFAVRKARNLVKIDFGVADFQPQIKFDSIADIIKLVTDISTLTIPVKVGISLKNYSGSSFDISQVKAGIYTSDGVLLADPKQPMTEKITIVPNNTTVVYFDYWLNVPGMLALAKNLPGDTDKEKILNLLKTWFTKGAVGVQIRMKGFATAEGLTFNFNELLDI